LYLCASREMFGCLVLWRSLHHCCLCICNHRVGRHGYDKHAANISLLAFRTDYTSASEQFTMTAVCWEKCHNACWSLEEKTIGLEAVRPAVSEANDLLFPLGVLALPAIG